MKQKFIPSSVIGKTLEQALSIIYSDNEYIGTSKRYWLSVPVSFDNVSRFIRFPSGNAFSLVFDDTTNHIITSVYYG